MEKDGIVSTRVSDESLVSDRHEQIVKTATDLFLQRGFHKTSVRAIAEAAGLQIGTLYLYISRKEDVLYLITQAIMGELWESLQQVEPRPTAREFFTTAAESFFRACNRRRREMRLLYRESASLLPHQLNVLKQTELKEREFFASIIRTGIERGEFRSVNPDIMAHNVIALASMWALKAWSLIPLMDFETYLQEQLSFLTNQLIDTPSNSPT